MIFMVVNVLSSLILVKQIQRLTESRWCIPKQVDLCHRAFERSGDSQSGQIVLCGRARMESIWVTEDNSAVQFSSTQVRPTMTKKDKTMVYRAPALDKGLEILELLAEVKAPMTLTQIASVLNRSRSELYRMTAVLVDRGYLVRDASNDALHISNRLFDLGMKASPVGTLVEVAFPTLHSLSEATRQSCHLAVASGYRMVVIARVESPSNVGIAVRVGHHLDLYESGSGLALLAWMPENQREETLQRYSHSGSKFDRRKLDSMLQRGRKLGYLRSKSSLVESVEDLSCPVFMGDHEHVIASLTVPYLKGKAAEVTVKDTLQHLQQAAAELSTLSVRHGGF